MKKFLTSKIGNILLCIAEIIVGVLLLVNPDAVTSAFIIGAGGRRGLRSPSRGACPVCSWTRGWENSPGTFR